MPRPFRYKNLAYVVLGTPELDGSIEFYRDLMGLELTHYEPGQHALFRCSEYLSNFVLCQNEHPGVMRLGMMVENNCELEKAQAHFNSRGYDTPPMSEADRQLFTVGEAFSILEKHTGITVDYFDSMVVPALPFKPTVTKIERLGHVVLRVTELDGVWKIFEDDFNLVTSDYVDGKAAWMRCYPNPLHHSVALVQEESGGLHHVNFMVSEIDDIGRARNRLMNQGVDIVFGPGRHKPSGSVFLYYNDPVGMTMEFSFGMEEFPEENPREPRKLQLSAQVMDLWGGMPSPDFAKTGAILCSNKS